MSIIDNVIDDLIYEYEKAKRYRYVINNPIAYALYQVCHKYDDQEIQYMRNKREDYEARIRKCRQHHTAR